jgi:hypothetical protein
MWAGLDAKTYLKLLKKNYGLREIIKPDVRRKIYFDLDIPLTNGIWSPPHF